MSFRELGSSHPFLQIYPVAEEIADMASFKVKRVTPSDAEWLGALRRQFEARYLFVSFMD